MLSVKNLEEVCLLLKITCKKAKLDVKTRWGSTLSMLERYFEFDPAFQYIFCLKSHEVINQNYLSNEDKHIVKNLIMILKEVETASNYFSHDKKPCITEVLMIFSGMSEWFTHILKVSGSNSDEVESSENRKDYGLDSSRTLK